MFERRFLNETQELYQAEGARLLIEKNVPEYLAHVQRRLDEESERQIYYLDFSTRKPLIAIVEQQLIANHSTALLSKGVEQLLSENRIEDLRLLYDLFGRVKNGHQELRTFVINYIKVKINIHIVVKYLVAYIERP